MSTIDFEYKNIFNTYCQTLRADGWIIAPLELPGQDLPYLIARKDGYEPKLISIPDHKRKYSSPTTSKGLDSNDTAYHIHDPSDNSA